jgi:hypothetical protein
LKADEKKVQKQIAEEGQPPNLIKASSQMYRPQKKDMGKRNYQVLHSRRLDNRKLSRSMRKERS